MMQKPDVDLIEGLSPAIAIEQRTARMLPRLLVALKLLWLIRISAPKSARSKPRDTLEEKGFL